MGLPGVWFLSLDATHPLGVWVARNVFRLPYLRTRMQLTQQGNTFHAEAERTHRGANPATFAASWTVGERLPTAQPGSLPHFLTERYHLYTAGPDVRPHFPGVSLWRGPPAPRALAAARSHPAALGLYAAGQPRPAHAARPTPALRRRARGGVGRGTSGGSSRRPVGTTALVAKRNPGQIWSGFLIY